MKMNIEKALRNYLKGSGPRVKYKAFYESASKDPNATINVIFELLNEEVDSMTDTKCLNKTIELINYLKIIISNFDEINRKLTKDALALGRVTMEESFTKGYYPDLNEFSDEPMEFDDNIDNPYSMFYAICFDRKGKWWFILC